MDSGEDLQKVSLPGAGETERTIFEKLAVVGSSSLLINQDKEDVTISEPEVIDVIKVEEVNKTVIEVDKEVVNKEEETEQEDLLEVDEEKKKEIEKQDIIEEAVEEDSTSYKEEEEDDKEVVEEGISDEEVLTIKEYIQEEDKNPNEDIAEVKNLLEFPEHSIIDISLLEDEDNNSISDQISANTVIHLDEIIINDNQNITKLNSSNNNNSISSNIDTNSSDLNINNIPVCDEQENNNNNNNNNNNDQSSDVDVGGNSLRNSNNNNEKSENINEVNTLNEQKIESVCVGLINDQNIIVEKLNNQNNNEVIDCGIVHEEHEEETDINKHDKPPIPIQTYRWEEIRRAKQQGGYPWTHLYKSPLGPDDEPEIILRFNISPQNRRKVQQQLIDTIDIPKSPKKVRIQKEVSFQEADEIPELDNNNLENISPVVQEEICEKEVSVASLTASPKSILKRSHPKKIDIKAASSSSKSHPKSDEEDSPKKSKCCPYPFVEKLKTMADKQLHKVSARKVVKKNPLSDIPLEEEQKVLRLKESPRANHRGIISYVEKQDSDEILELIDYEESPGEARKHRQQGTPDPENSTLTPDEIIELPTAHMEDETDEEETDFAKPVEEDIIVAASKSGVKADPPPKAPRKKKDHVYEDIESPQDHNNNFIAEIGSNEAIKISLQAQDMQVLDDINGKQKYLDETISDEQDEVQTPKISLLAPISSIDSTSSDEDRRVLLPTLSEESETSTSDITVVPMKNKPNQEMNAHKKIEEKLLLTDDANQEKSEIESAEPKPTNHEKKVTFMNAEESDNEAQVCEIRKEDVPVAPELSIPIDSRWSKMSDHEYEPIGDPIVESVKLTTPSPTFYVSAPSNDGEIENMDMEGAVGGVVDDKDMNGYKRPASEASSITSHERKLLRVPAEDECEDDELSVDEIQKQIEDKYFNTPQMTTDVINTDEINSTEVDASAIDDMPSEAEIKKKGIFSGTQQRGKIMQAKLRTQAGKIKTKLRGMKKAKSESPKAKVQRKKFRPIEFSKFKRPEMPKFSKPEFKRPEFTKFSKPEFKRPEFTKFNKPEFKRPEFTKFSKPEFKRPEFTKFSKPEFKRPEFTKFSKPEFKRPEFTKFSKPEFKRPEFTKFKKPNFPEFQMFKRSDSKTTEDSEIPTSSDSRRLSKPEVSRFRIPEKLSSLRLRRSKSLKEKPVSTSSTSPGSTEDEVPVTSTPTNKKFFDFHFGTYPRILQKKKKHKNIAVDDIEVLRTPTPTTFEFATVPRSKKSGLSEQITNIKNSDDDSGRYKQYDYDIEQERERERERESSVERRMRMTFERSSIEMEDEALGILHTDEQKQMAEFDKENREIHNISKIKKDDHKYKQSIERQESDPISEDAKQMEWNSHMNRTDSDLRSDELDLPQEYDDEMEHHNGDLSPSRSNVETRSSGSSSLRHKPGVIEEIDDDEFFLRKKGISEDNIQIGEYISSAIREGLGTPRNALANVGNYGNYYDDEDEDEIEAKDGRYKMEFSGYDVPRSYSQKSDRDDYEDEKDDSKNDEGYKGEPRGDDYCRTFPPNRPLRKSRKQSENDDPAGYGNFQPYFYENERMEGIEQPNILVTNNEDNERDFVTMNFYENHIEEECVRPATPPKAPKRRKKVKRDLPAFNQRINELSKEMPIISDSTIPNGDTDKIIVYRTEHEYTVPVAQSVVIAPPSPLPRRSRSHSQTSNNRLPNEIQKSQETEQISVDHKPAKDFNKNFNDLRDADGYAIVKKEPPPRPPAPLRRKRSTRSLGDKQFATMPHMRKGITPPVRPRRTYSTIGPSRPPRRKSASSLQNIRSYTRDTTHSSPDVTQYEELGGETELQNESHRDLQSGDVINKMKYRPLPPPPRPPRELKKHKKPDEDDDDDNNKQDKDDGAEFITEETELVKHVVDDEIAPKIEEVEVSTQTDPLPDDFCCEEFEITDDMRTISPSISPSKSKTLEDILREQEADMEIVEQITAEQSLARGLQRFREANQRSYSERSKTSDHQRRSSSRPATPAAFIIERKVSTPIPMSVNNLEDMITEASLIVQPVDVDINNNENAYEEEELEKTSNLSTFVEKSDTDKLSLDEPLTEEEQQIILDALSRFDQEQKELNTYDDEIKVNNFEVSEDVTVDVVEPTFLLEESEHFESQPVAPPRKKSLGETLATTVVDSPEIDVNEEQSVPAKRTETTGNENPLSNRMQISELEVDRLSVNELQAGRIMVSQLEGMSINAQELDCQSGSLIVRNIELPAGFIEELIDRIRSSEHSHMQSEDKETTEKVDAPQNENQTETKLSNEDAPERPPPPQQYNTSEYLPYSIPPPSFFQLRNYSEEDLPNPPVARRRRHHRRRESTSDEEHQQREQRTRRHGTRSPEPTVTELGSQFAHACGASLLQSGNQLMNMLKAASKDENKKDLHIAVVILLIIITGILLLGNSDKSIHHHHWEYFNPPGNSGSQ